MSKIVPNGDFTDEKVQHFEKTVRKSFEFLEKEFGMYKGNARILNRKDPREITVVIRYKSEDYQIDIGWGISEKAIGILIWNKHYHTSSSIDKKIYIYFEPFIEFLTNGKDKPIIPQIYPKMSVKKIAAIMDERKQLFELPLCEIIDKLAEKLKLYYEKIITLDCNLFLEFQHWFNQHQ
jgi:hypothetical protein